MLFEPLAALCSLTILASTKISASSHSLAKASNIAFQTPACPGGYTGYKPSFWGHSVPASPATARPCARYKISRSKRVGHQRALDHAWQRATKAQSLPILHPINQTRITQSPSRRFESMLLRQINTIIRVRTLVTYCTDRMEPSEISQFSVLTLILC